MNLEQWLLLAAIALTFAAWRRARAQSERVRQSAAERLAGLTYTLEARESDSMRGFAILDADGAELSPDDLNWQEHGLAVVRLHSAALELVPGTALKLEPTAGGDAIEVMLEETGAVCEVLRGADTGAVLEGLPETAAAYVLQERRDGAVLPEVTILLIHRDVALEGEGR